MLVLDGIMQICLKRLLSTDAHSLQGLTCTAYYGPNIIISYKTSFPFRFSTAFPGQQKKPLNMN